MSPTLPIFADYVQNQLGDMIAGFGLGGSTCESIDD